MKHETRIRTPESIARIAAYRAEIEAAIAAVREEDAGRIACECWRPDDADDFNTMPWKTKEDCPECKGSGYILP